MLDNGDREDLNLVQPIVALDPSIPAGAVAVGGQPLTVALQPVEIQLLPAIPGGPANTDLLLVVRPGTPPVAGTVPWGALPSGGGGSTAMTASAAVSGHRAVMFDGSGGVVHADPSSASYQFAGITTQAASPSTTVQVAETGVIVEPSWAWTPGQPVYVGPSGVLTQTPPVSGACQQVAVAIGATSILIQPYPPITRH